MLSPSSENSKHPASDTQIDTKSMFWQAASLPAPAYLPQDLLTPQTINFIALLSHNIEATGVTIKFEGADDGDFDGGDLVSRTLAYRATDIFEFISPFTKQFVRVALEKGTDFTDYPIISTVVCGEYFKPNRNFKWGYEKGPEDHSEGDFSDSMNLFSQERPNLDTWSISFEGLNDVSASQIISLLQDHKIVRAFVVAFDPDDTPNESHFVRFASVSRPRHEDFNNWTWEAELIEVL